MNHNCIRWYLQFKAESDGQTGPFKFGTTKTACLCIIEKRLAR